MWVKATRSDHPEDLGKINFSPWLRVTAGPRSALGPPPGGSVASLCVFTVTANMVEEDSAFQEGTYENYREKKVSLLEISSRSPDALACVQSPVGLGAPAGSQEQKETGFLFGLLLGPCPLRPSSTHPCLQGFPQSSCVGEGIPR